MPIRVTCPGCHARFNVSEKFAGKQGPCPKCKRTIKIPGVDEEVVIHAPEPSGPTDSRGQSISKPIGRTETQLSVVQLVLIFGSMLLFFVIALMLRWVDVTQDVQNLLLYAGALCVAIPVSFAAYTFLRDQDRGSFRGRELWIRIAVCGLIYALLWLAMPIFGYAFPGNAMGTVFALGAMIGAGGAVGMLTLNLDYMMGILHYGMYLVVCLIGRLLVGIEVLPTMGAPSNQPPAAATACLESILQLISVILQC